MALAERSPQRVRPFLLWRKGTALGLGGLTLSVLIASCGGGGSTRATAGSVSTAIGAASAPTTAAAGSPATALAKGVVISAAQSGRFGTILVSGTTLYTLKPSQTACTAECLRIWPPLLLPQGVGSATAGPGVNASKLGTLMAVGGRLQVTYSGQALYWFSGDTAPGQVNGNVTDIWGKWSVVGIGGSAAASPASGALVTSTTAASSRNSPAPTTSSNSTAPPTTAGSSTTSPPTTRAVTTTTRAPTTTTTTTAPTTTTTAPTSGGGAF